MDANEGNVAVVNKTFTFDSKNSVKSFIEFEEVEIYEYFGVKKLHYGLFLLS
jgi:hypothetical protein